MGRAFNRIMNLFFGAEGRGGRNQEACEANPTIRYYRKKLDVDD
jgi:hypothetical protein